MKILCLYGNKNFREIDAIKAQYEEDKRSKKGANSRPSRKHIRHGCQCHFSVQILAKKAHLALLTYLEMEHVDQDGKICHG